MSKMNALKKLVLAAFVALSGLRGSLWAESAGDNGEVSFTGSGLLADGFAAKPSLGEAVFADPKAKLAKAMVPCEYFVWNEAEMRYRFLKCTDYTVVTDETRMLESGWYVVNGKVSISGAQTDEPGILVNGDVHLILVDGAELSVAGADCSAGILVSVDGSATNSLSIYGQRNGTGVLKATGGSGGAGIGGGENAPGGVVTINGGTVEATGGDYGAGIGGGMYGAGGKVNVYGGKVKAIGGGYGAGIGGGADGSGAAVTIVKGKVTAFSYIYGDGSENYFWGEGIGAGLNCGRYPQPGTLDFGAATNSRIVAGFWDDGSDAEAVDAGDFSYWHQYPYVQVLASCRTIEPSLTIVSVKSLRPGGVWAGGFEFVYNLFGMDVAKSYAVAVELVVGDLGVGDVYALDFPEEDGVYSFDDYTSEDFFGELVQDPAAELYLFLYELED